MERVRDGEVRGGDAARRSAFATWLRTGRLPVARGADGLELKYNPWHDPEDGRFTFAGTGRYFPRGGSGGGGGSAASAGAPRSIELWIRGSGTGERFAAPPRIVLGAPGGGAVGQDAARVATTGASPIGASIFPGGVASPPTAHQVRPPGRPGLPGGRGGNSRAFEDPMTLEQSFPGLRNAPGGAIVAVADNLFDLHGPADAAVAEVLQNEARRLTAEIRTLDPNWRYDEIVPADARGNPVRSVQGLTAKVEDLRFHRAAVIARTKGNYEPLQVETLRFVQRRADEAYDRGIILLKAGRLTPKLSDQEALGNYVDQRVRVSLRARYGTVGIDSAGKGPVRVNRRENISSTGDLTYRRPDARVDDLAFDVTLTQKTLRTAQVRGFFDADSRPSRVIIIRPSRLGEGHTYAISRPEKTR